MGEASSKAQGLYTIITTGRKLQLSDHILYVMKDAAGNGGRGSVVGILKIGRKKLFVYSDRGNVHEMEPMCVLDFYVHESRQRMGCGRKLFDFMLEDIGVRPCHLAIDKPSYKFSQFLKKHFHLRAEIPQVNNFVVFEGFFSNKSDFVQKKRVGYGRPPPGNNREPQIPVDDGYQQPSSYNGYGRPPLPPTSQAIVPNLPNISNQQSSMAMRPPSGPSSAKSRSGSVLSNGQNSRNVVEYERNGTLPVEYERNGQLRPLSNTRDEPEARSLSANQLKSKGKQIYSRHLNHSESPIGQLNGSRPPSGSSINRHNTVNGDLTKLNLQTRTQNNSHYGSDPLIMKRGVTSDFNLHQTYQDRRGHVRTNSAYEASIRNPFFSKEEEIAVNGWQPSREQPSWTVFDGSNSYLALAKRNYTHTRLW
ncbi:Alpha-tubulin N-acetyltransferase 1 [Mactra antiquata]